MDNILSWALYILLSDTNKDIGVVYLFFFQVLFLVNNFYPVYSSYVGQKVYFKIASQMDVNTATVDQNVNFLFDVCRKHLQDDFDDEEHRSGVLQVNRVLIFVC